MYYYHNLCPYQYVPSPMYPIYPVENNHSVRWRWQDRQQVIKGEATWTLGGKVTKCGIPWSDNQYMTVAIGENAPYQCGENLKVRNPANGREVIVTVVDQVRGFPNNRINLHRRAFEALGARLDQGVINIEIIPSPELEKEKWGKYLLELVQTAYPNYQITDYKSVGRTEESPNRIKETFDFVVHDQEDERTIRGNVIYNPQTDRVISFDLAEI